MSIQGWIEAGLAEDDEASDVVMADHLGAQAWHADGPHLFDADVQLPPHAMTVFFPLIDPRTTMVQQSFARAATCAAVSMQVERATQREQPAFHLRVLATQSSSTTGCGTAALRILTCRPTGTVHGRGSEVVARFTELQSGHIARVDLLIF